MSFTYEFENKNERLETYEWDNVWWEHADKDDINRVLYIGDSISCGTRRIATETANGEMYFDGLGTSKGIDNPFFFDTISMFAKQQGSRSAVLFNNGLHGWHLDDENGYKCYYELMIQFLITEFDKTPVYLVLTTHVADGERDRRVVARNAVVCELAKQYGLPVIDLYTPTLENAQLISGDGVHLVKEGYQMLADCIIKEIKA